MPDRGEAQSLAGPDDRGRDVPLLVVGIIFGVSGISALVYQVAWQRILTLHSGAGIYSVAMIVAAFLSGLGLGSYGGGRLSVRTGPLGALGAFAALELGIGLFAAASCFIYYDLLYLELPEIFANPWRAGIVHFLLLLFPTMLMGMSLPFLVRGTVRDPRTASITIGTLYGVNVLGAALGSLLAPWLLMRLVGVRGAVAVAAAGNILSGLAALMLVVWLRRATPVRDDVQVGASPQEPASRRPFALWVALYTLSGFCALALEILWFRLTDVAVKSTAFTFGTVLAIYLLGLGAGCIAGGPLALRVKRPLKTFLLCQCVVLLYAGAALLALVSLPSDWPIYRELVRHWQQYEEFPLGRLWDGRMIFLLYLVLPGFLYGPPTFLMGVSFSVLQRAVHDERQTSGLKVGLLQAGNIAGNVAGSLVAGLLLLDLAGTIGVMSLLLVVGLVFAVLGMAYFGWRTSFGVLGLGMLLLLVLLPSSERLWLRLHGVIARDPFRVSFFSEDATSVGAITPDGDALRVSVNGKGNSWLPFGGLHSQLGALPAAVHPAPQDVAIIGLGSGDTTWAAAFRQETERVTVFEISAGQADLLARTAADIALPELRSLLANDRIEVVVADGRNALATSDRKYDIIEADALRPHSAFSGNIYSVEFFRLCARRLKAGGLMCTWVPTQRTYLTFCEAFPHVLEFAGGAILIGSNDPIPVDSRAWNDRLSSPVAQAYLGTIVAQEVLQVLPSVLPATPELFLGLGTNRDLFPRDELVSPPGR